MILVKVLFACTLALFSSSDAFAAAMSMGDVTGSKGLRQARKDEGHSVPLHRTVLAQWQPDKGPVPATEGMAAQKLKDPAHIERLAKEGNAEAQYLMGEKICDVDSPPYTETLRWFEKAARQGHLFAKARLAQIAFSQEKPGAGNMAKAILPEIKQRANGGKAEAQYFLGMFLYEGLGVPKNERKAVEWFRKAAEKGNDSAQIQLGICYAEGIGVQKDERKAVEWAHKAAEQGNADAQTYLGLCYTEGKGVPKDERKAVEWTRKAAEQGNANAQAYLGFCYAEGIGVQKDEHEALAWSRKAAEQGNAYGQYLLGLCYYTGAGVQKNTDEAKQWIKKSAAQGYTAAQKALKNF